MPQFYYGIDIAKHSFSICGEYHQDKVDICHEPWNHFKNINSGGLYVALASDDSLGCI